MAMGFGTQRAEGRRRVERAGHPDRYTLQLAKAASGLGKQILAFTCKLYCILVDRAISTEKDVNLGPDIWA